MAAKPGQTTASQEFGLKRFDYASCGFGIAATLYVMLFPNGVGPLLFFIEALAASICLLFLSMLAANFVTHHLNRSEMRIAFYHVASNLVPTLHLLSRLKETPWEKFVG